MRKETVQYIKYNAVGGVDIYAVYRWDGYAAQWVWEEDKLTEYELTKKYPETMFNLEEIKDE